MSRHRDWDLQCKVYVGNLGNNASKNELESAFSKYGPLKNVWVARNPPGFAFIEFEDPRDAEDAVRHLDGTRMCGVRVRVEMSTGRSRGRGGGGGPPRRHYRRDKHIFYYHLLLLPLRTQQIHFRVEFLETHYTYLADLDEPCDRVVGCTLTINNQPSIHSSARPFAYYIDVSFISDQNSSVRDLPGVDSPEVAPALEAAPALEDPGRTHGNVDNCKQPSTSEIHYSFYLHSVFKIICLFSLTITSYLFDTFIIQLMLLITQVNLKKTKIIIQE